MDCLAEKLQVDTTTNQIYWDGSVYELVDLHFGHALSEELPKSVWERIQYERGFLAGRNLERRILKAGRQ